jgi:hypothetical protein
MPGMELQCNSNGSSTWALLQVLHFLCPRGFLVLEIPHLLSVWTALLVSPPYTHLWFLPLSSSCFLPLWTDITSVHNSVKLQSSLKITELPKLTWNLRRH